MTSKRCLYPHLAFSLEAFGKLRLCSSYQEDIYDLKNESVNLLEFINSNIMKELRHSFETNLPKGCSSCLKQEKDDVPSKREIFNRKRSRIYGENFIEEVFSESNKKVLHLSIGISNNCNLQCAMCSSKYSQKWQQDERKYNEENIDTKVVEIFSSFQLGQKNIDELVEIASECSDVFIKGGEPFYCKNTLSFMEKLSKKEKKPHIFVQSNATIVNDEVSRLIEKLNIEIGISIDGVDDVYEWIRGFSYNKLNENIIKLSNLSTDHKMSLDYTSSIYNVCEVDSFINQMQNLQQKNEKISHISVVSIARQVRNDLRNLPLSFRQQINDKLSLLNSDCIESDEVIKKTLNLAQLDENSQQQARQWLSYLEKTRGPIPMRKHNSFEQWARGIK